VIGSNCVNLLAGPFTWDLKNKDFSDCAVPHAYLYKRNLTKCNFSGANMNNSVITAALTD
jgi:uncharacterized protein YjbI with pentapeptide repeats